MTELIKKKALISWSTGKDSALALHKVIESQQYEIMGLLTCITKDYNRVSIHGIYTNLLEAQADSLGLPVYPIFIPAKCSMLQYQDALQSVLKEVKCHGIDTIIFGDIFLQDVRDFRIEQLSKQNMTPISPLWGKNTKDLSEEVISIGIKSLVSCVDAGYLGQEYTAREYDSQFLVDLPEKVDPCGENGEFHTFVYAGPIFNKKIGVKIVDKILRGQSYYADIQLVL